MTVNNSTSGIVTISFVSQPTSATTPEATVTRVISNSEVGNSASRAGRRGLEAFAGLHYVNIGYGWQENAEALTAQANEFEEMILVERSGTIAAFIGESVLGTGGIMLPPAGCWKQINAGLINSLDQ